jgi:hypothetical protein
MNCGFHKKGNKEIDNLNCGGIPSAPEFVLINIKFANSAVMITVYG